MSIDFEAATDGDTKNHFDLVKWCEQTESKVIVGGTLLSQADGKTSTNAQSQTHEVQFEKLVKSDAKQLARSINDCLIKYLMQLNHPEIAPDRYPSFYFDTTDTEDMEVFSEALPKLVEIGFQIPRAWGHKKLGIPEPADDKEPVLAVVQQAQLAVNRMALPAQYLAALNQNPVSSAHPAELSAIYFQNLLDEQVQQRLDNQHVQQQAETLLPQLIERLGQADDIEGALAMLTEAFPDRDLQSLQDDLETLIFASDVLGRLSTHEGRKRG